MTDENNDSDPGFAWATELRVFPQVRLGASVQWGTWYALR